MSVNDSRHARFLAPLTNDRRDEYGAQTVESRSRFKLRVAVYLNTRATGQLLAEQRGDWWLPCWL